MSDNSAFVKFSILLGSMTADGLFDPLQCVAQKNLREDEKKKINKVRKSNGVNKF